MKLITTNRNLLYLLAACLLTFTFGCKGAAKTTENEKPDDSDIPAMVLKKYKEDAARLALRDLNARRAGIVTAADLPKQRIEYYYDKLKKIYRLILATEEIPDITHIHTHTSPHLTEVLVVLEKDCPWKDRWKDGIISTEDINLNQLTGRYNMKIEAYREGALGPTMKLVANKFINTKEMARLLVHVEGISIAEPEGVIGDGNNIQTALSTNERNKMLFSIGWGDCPSGCIHRAYWSFEIQSNGAVIYVGQSGDTPPEDLGKTREVEEEE